MELWIRSQDRKRFVQIDELEIKDYNGYYYVLGNKKGVEYV